jgi:hypothetical protein
MAKIRCELSLYKIKIHLSDSLFSGHVLYSDWVSLDQLINHIDCFDDESIEFHKKVIRARERLYSRWGNCSFES